MPWGARAALEDIEKQCKTISASLSIFHPVKYVYIFVSSSMFSFVINDIYNGQVGKQVGGIIVPALAFIIPMVIFAFSFVFKQPENKNKNENEKKGGDIGIGVGAEIEPIYKTDINQSAYDETINPMSRKESSI